VTAFVREDGPVVDGPGRQPRTGTKVEVRTRFDGSWSPGFEVAEVLEDGAYRIRRATDGEVLPSLFDPAEVRRERARSTWWI
jgi:hypothetical protein